MDKDHIAQIAEQVSILMQLDRTRHKVPTSVDMKALANVPGYIASVFEQANRVATPLSPTEAYEMINKRVSQIQAQLYLMRVEMENRTARDPARIYDDPLAISAYGERLETIVRATKSFSFGPEILAYGWYPLEQSGSVSRRWMRPVDVSVACVPHLGTVDQVIEIGGYVLDHEKLASLEIRVGDVVATITPQEAGGTHFVARLSLKGEALKSANYVPIEFRMGAYRQPNAMDTRLLGANIGSFVLRPADIPPLEEALIEELPVDEAPADEGAEA